MSRKAGFVTNQVKRLSDGQINRRRFIMSAMSAGVTLPTATLLANQAQAMSPRKGGVLRIGLPDSPQIKSLIPTGRAHPLLRHVNLMRGNTLTEVAPNGDITGGLADQFAASADNRVWQFQLRDGVTFHDGKPLDAGDVVASLNLHRQSVPGLRDIADIQTDGPTRLSVSLTHPDPAFARKLTDDRLIILSAFEGRVDPNHPSGTGAYMLRVFAPDTGAKLVRNPHYWKPDSAHFDAIDLRAMTDPGQRQAAIMGGEIDLALGIDPRAVALIQTMPSVRLLETEGDHPLALDFAGSRTSPEMRRTISALIPRADIVEQILLGHGRAEKADPIPPRAQPFLPHQSGLVRISIHENETPGAHAMAKLIAQRADAKGIEIQVVPKGAEADCALCSFDGHETSGAAMVFAHANGLAAHSDTLGFPTPVNQSIPIHHQRIHERWWFTAT